MFSVSRLRLRFKAFFTVFNIVPISETVLDDFHDGAAVIDDGSNDELTFFGSLIGVAGCIPARGASVAWHEISNQEFISNTRPEKITLIRERAPPILSSMIM